MTTDVEVGDRFLLKYFPYCKHFGEVEVTIYQIDKYDLLIYSDEAASKRLGHYAAYREDDWDKFTLPEPNKRYGSWWISKVSLEELIITKLPKEVLVNRHPNWKIIRKIKEMQDRRRKMGYEYV